MMGNAASGCGQGTEVLSRPDVRQPLSAPFRVLFRADVLQKRMREREKQELEQLREERERQDRLEALRKQVNYLPPLTV